MFKIEAMHFGSIFAYSKKIDWVWEFTATEEEQFVLLFEARMRRRQAMNTKF